MDTEFDEIKARIIEEMREASVKEGFVFIPDLIEEIAAAAVEDMKPDYVWSFIQGLKAGGALSADASLREMSESAAKHMGISTNEAERLLKIAEKRVTGGIGMSYDDDAFCLGMYQSYLNDPERGDFVSFDDAVKECWP